MSRSFSGPNKNHAVNWLKAGGKKNMLGLFLDHEDGSYIFLRNVSRLSTDNAELYLGGRGLHNHLCEKKLN
jgi:hypothetical protein